MSKFGYNIDKDGNVLACGFDGVYCNYLDGSEPFSEYDILFYKKGANGWTKINRILKTNQNWHEPDWQYRILLTNEQLVFLTLNYFDMLISMNTPPINPRYEVDNGVLVYLNTFTQDGKDLLSGMGVNIEEFIN